MAEVINMNDVEKEVHFFYKSKNGMLHAVKELRVAENNNCEGGKIVADSVVPVANGWPMYGDDAVMVDLQTMGAVKDNRTFDFKAQMPRLFEIAGMLK